MTQQIINVGSAINDGTGDPARTAFTKCNDNFTELYAAAWRGYIDGLILAWVSNTSFSVAAGQASNDANAVLMNLAASVTKTTSAWAVGSGNGGLDTGSIAAAVWYHVFLIRRSDTGVVDVLFSTSATAPTMPGSYNQKRRIGSIKTNASSQLLSFVQIADVFYFSAPTAEVVATNPGTSAVTRTLAGVPTGVRVQANLNVGAAASVSEAGPAAIYISDLAVSDIVPNQGTSSSFLLYLTGNPGTHAAQGCVSVWTNTSAQIRSRLQVSSTNITLYIGSFGWTDPRGTDA